MVSHTVFLQKQENNFNWLKIKTLRVAVLWNPVLVAFLVSVFCSKCVAVNPFDSKVSRSRVVFITGCDNQKCVADLKLSSEVLSP